MRPDGRIAAITGGAGFVGSALAHRLVADGWRVVAIDSLVNGKRENIADLPADRAKLLVADIRRPADFAEALAGVNAVFHLACLGVRHSLHSPMENRSVNVDGTRAILGAARAAGAENFVHVSSSEVYGASGDGSLAEDSPTRPTTPYAEAKLAAEALARAAHGAGGMRVAILRPFNAYGPRGHHEGDAGEVIPKFLLRALVGRPLIVFGDGQQTRDFTYVENTADGIARAAECEAAAGRTINLGSGRAIRVLDLARLVGEAVGRPAEIVHRPPRPGDTPHLCADVRAAANVLGWRAEIGLEAGLRRLYRWYRDLNLAPARLLAGEIEENWQIHGVPPQA